MKYSVVDVSKFEPENLEQLGTKEKYWFVDDQNRNVLFKIGRPGTGENWAEVVASRLCDALGIPHAFYDFAVSGANYGVVTPSFLGKNQRLVLGNEFLFRVKISDDDTKQLRPKSQSLHTLVTVMTHQIKRKPAGYRSYTDIKTALDFFIGYLMFDALISNQDRHNENWGMVVSTKDKVHLAPTFDHAASLGRNESDQEREDRLTTKDRLRSVSHYVQKAKSHIYFHNKQLKTLEAFELVGKYSPDATKTWIRRLSRLHPAVAEDIVGSVPTELMSDWAKSFALEMLKCNKKRILNLA